MVKPSPDEARRDGKPCLVGPSVIVDSVTVSCVAISPGCPWSEHGSPAETVPAKLEMPVAASEQRAAAGVGPRAAAGFSHCILIGGDASWVENLATTPGL